MNNVQLLLAMRAAALSSSSSENRWYSGRKPTGGHRAPGYKRTPADMERLEAAAQRRSVRAAKRYAAHCKAQALNPCMRGCAA